MVGDFTREVLSDRQRERHGHDLFQKPLPNFPIYRVYTSIVNSYEYLVIRDRKTRNLFQSEGTCITILVNAYCFHEKPPDSVAKVSAVLLFRVNETRIGPR